MPFVNREIPVIGDDYVEKDFGSGFVKITPAHDVNDYEIGIRHNLPVLDIIDDHGRLNEKAQILVGEDRFEARKKIEGMLREAGNLEKTEEKVWLDSARQTLVLRATSDNYDFLIGKDEKSLQKLGTIAPQLMSTEVVGGFTGVVLGIYVTGTGSADFKSFDYRH